MYSLIKAHKFEFNIQVRNRIIGQVTRELDSNQWVAKGKDVNNVTILRTMSTNRKTAVETLLKELIIRGLDKKD